MLRFDHMPSDFHPIFLFLGDREDLIQLAGLLRAFAAKPEETNVRQSIPGSGGRSQLSLLPAEGIEAPFGLRATSKRNFYTWVLNAWQAEQVAAKIDALTLRELKSGNDIIEFGLDGEIPIKISRGEFTDNFLTPGHHLDPDYQEATGTASEPI